MTPESLADDVLSRMRGYNFRQTWTPQDRQFLIDIFSEWDREVLDLETRLMKAEQELDGYRAYHHEYVKGLLGPRAHA